MASRPSGQLVFELKNLTLNNYTLLIIKKLMTSHHFRNLAISFKTAGLILSYDDAFSHFKKFKSLKIQIESVRVFLLIKLLNEELNILTHLLI